MFKKIEYWWKERKIRKAWEGSGADEYQGGEEYAHEMFQLGEEQQQYYDNKLIKKARRYYIPIPPHSDKNVWEEHCEDEWFLTEKGVSFLRKSVREEQKASRERILAWVPLISAIAVLLGAILGLLHFFSN